MMMLSCFKSSHFCCLFGSVLNFRKRLLFILWMSASNLNIQGLRDQNGKNEGCLGGGCAGRDGKDGSGDHFSAYRFYQNTIEKKRRDCVCVCVCVCVVSFISL